MVLIHLILLVLVIFVLRRFYVFLRKQLRAWQVWRAARKEKRRLKELDRKAAFSSTTIVDQPAPVRDGVKPQPAATTSTQSEAPTAPMPKVFTEAVNFQAYEVPTCMRLPATKRPATKRTRRSVIASPAKETTTEISDAQGQSAPIEPVDPHDS